MTVRRRAQSCEVIAVRRGGGAFAMPLVMLLALVSSLAVIGLMSRQTESRLAVERQVTGYESHHLQQGLKELTQFWLTVSKRTDGSKLATDVVGYDMRLKDGYTVEVRLYDAQGSLLRSLDPWGAIAGDPMDAASDALVEKGKANRSNVRFRGPAKLSIHAAPPEALEALAMAVDPSASGAAFADAVVRKRMERDLTQADITEVCGVSGLKDAALTKLQNLLVAESSFWRIEATLKSRTGTILQRQGGLANGQLKQSLMGTSNSWAVLTWGPLPTKVDWRTGHAITPQGQPADTGVGAEPPATGK